MVPTKTQHTRTFSEPVILFAHGAGLIAVAIVRTSITMGTAFVLNIRKLVSIWLSLSMLMISIVIVPAFSSGDDHYSWR